MDQVKNPAESLKGSEIEKFFKDSVSAVWVIRDEGNKFQCGGVCVHSNGIILSVAFLAIDTKMKTLKGWCMALNEFVPLDVVSVDRKRNVSMLRIRDTFSSSHPVKYECLVLSNDEGVISGQTSITLVPSTGDKWGKPIRFYTKGVVAFPSGSERLAQESKDKELDNLYQDFKVHPYRTARHFIADWKNAAPKGKTKGEHPLLARYEGFMDDIADKKIAEMINNLDPDLPLTDIMGFPSWSSYILGCPVLDNTGKIMGLIGLAQWSHTYALTIATLKEFCEENKTVLGVDIVSENIMEVSESA